MRLDGDQAGDRDADRDDVSPHDSTALTSSYEARIFDLREALESEREANKENRRIIAALTQRIPAIESPEAHQAGVGGEAQEAQSNATDEPRRPWWRFW